MEERQAKDMKPRMNRPIEKIRYPLAYAQVVAEELIGLLAPACETFCGPSCVNCRGSGLLDEASPVLGPCISANPRIVIAGSMRRRRPDGGDIELLVISKVQRDLFGGIASYLLDEAVLALVHKGTLDYRLDGRGIRILGSLNKLMVHRASRIPVDIFTTTKENWGMALVVRTGSADFNKRLMARFRALGKAGHAYGGITLRDGSELECPTEEIVFREAEWEYIDPEARK